VNMDAFIESVISTADAVRARGRHKKKINLSFDEWNVWYISEFSGDGPKSNTEVWVPGPELIEDEFNITDAVVVGTFLNSLLRHGDRVTVACQAQLVNVIGLLRSEEGGDAWKQTIAYPFEQMRRLATGQIVQVVASGDKYDSPTYTDVPVVDAAATYDEATGRTALFVANRSLTESSTLEVDLRGVGATAVVEASTLHAGGGQDRHATNRVSHDAVAPRRFEDYVLEGGQLKVNLPALSWTVFSFEASRG
jgi:alpha-N-arabinofuranosidase